MSEWIKCSERLPEVGVYVLAYIDGEIEPCVCCLENKKSLFDEHTTEWEPSFTHYETAGYDHVISDIDQGKVTHWMPLPQPPEAE